MASRRICKAGVRFTYRENRRLERIAVMAGVGLGTLVRLLALDALRSPLSDDEIAEALKEGLNQ